MADTREVRVAAKRRVADGVLVLDLAAPDGGPLPAWDPGSHIDVHLPNGLVRQYSLCGDPRAATRYRIGVLREPASRGGSQCVHDDVATGDLLTISLPRNNLALEQAASYLFIAGGIGITPILAMVREVARRGADWRLLYGGRTASSMAFTAELAALEHGADRVVLHPQDQAGLLPLRQWLAEPRGDTLIYCCGPGPLLAAVEYEASLWPLRALRLERFTPRPLPQPARPTSFVVELARSRRSVTVDPDRSVLDVLAAAGIELLSSCREGVCGTCATRVLDGRPDHRDSILTAEARENGDRMYVCVSRSCSDRLVLDL